MSLAHQPSIPIDTYATLACHAAVWVWAQEEARAKGMIGGSSRTSAAWALDRVAMQQGGGQLAMLALPRAGVWDFSRGRNTPPIGTVLLWTGELNGPKLRATHSAVVTGPGQITSHDQPCIFSPFITTFGLTTGHREQLRPEARKCYMILETVIVRAAATEKFRVSGLRSMRAMAGL